jgi:hypothetical protein
LAPLLLRDTHCLQSQQLLVIIMFDGTVADGDGFEACFVCFDNKIYQGMPEGRQPL